MRNHCIIIALSLHYHCITISLSLHYHCIIISLSLHYYCIIIALSLHYHRIIIAYTLHYFCITIINQSIVETARSVRNLKVLGKLLITHSYHTLELLPLPKMNLCHFPVNPTGKNTLGSSSTNYCYAILWCSPRK